jgi:hypothetical protein
MAEYVAVQCPLLAQSGRSTCAYPKRIKLSKFTGYLVAELSGFKKGK